jgi:hypothetical protein
VEEYCLVNEPTHDYSLLTYYINIDCQIAQLRQVGFGGPLKAFNLAGDEIVANSEHAWLYYLARK